MASTTTENPVAAETHAGPGRQARLVVPYVVVLLCPLPMLTLQLGKLWEIKHYRYFPFLLAAVALLLWRRWRDLPDRPRCQPTRSSLVTLVVSLLLLLASVLLTSPWLGTVAAIVSVWGVVLSFGRQAAGRLAPVWLLLWLLLPLPFRWDERLVLWLQGLASEGGSRLLDAWGYNHVLAGYVLEIPGRQFLVEEVGRGVQSLFALVVAAALLAVWLRRGLVHGVLLVCSAPLWTLTVNMFGMALAVPLFAAGGVDVTGGGARTLFDLGLFLAELLILLSADRLLLCLLEPTGVKAALDEEGNLIALPREVIQEVAAQQLPETALPRPPAAGRWALRIIAAGFLAVGVLQGITWILHRQPIAGPTLAGRGSDGSERLPLTDMLSESSLPRPLGPWQPVGFRVASRTPESDLGRRSLAWRYRDSKDEAVVSLDFPFVGWHQVTACYEVRGWEMESRAVLAPAASSWPTLEVRMRDAGGRRGYLLVSQFTETGEALTPPAKAGWSFSTWCMRAYERVLNRFGETGSESATFQIQLLVTGDLPLDEARQGQAREAFHGAVRQLVERLWPGAEGESGEQGRKG